MFFNGSVPLQYKIVWQQHSHFLRLSAINSKYTFRHLASSLEFSSIASSIIFIFNCIIVAWPSIYQLFSSCNSSVAVHQKTGLMISSVPDVSLPSYYLILSAKNLTSIRFFTISHSQSVTCILVKTKYTLATARCTWFLNQHRAIPQRTLFPSPTTTCSKSKSFHRFHFSSQLSRKLHL